MLTLRSLTNIEGKNQTDRPIWNYATGALPSRKGCYAKPTVGKCIPMQVIKQSEHGRTSKTEEQK